MRFSFRSLQWLLIPVFTVAFISLEAQESDTINVTTTALFKGVIVTGNITNAATNKPLRGIRITYEDLSASITDSAGAFAIKVPDYNVALVLEGEGYQRKEIALKGRDRKSTRLNS